MESFKNSEFWYVEQGILTPEADGTSSFRKPLPRQEEKWWLPVPRVQPGGLSEDARRMLQHKRDCTNQILKAAMAINNAALAEMDIPDSYFEALPKVLNNKNHLLVLSNTLVHQLYDAIVQNHHFLIKQVILFSKNNHY